jgi:thioredoxin-dependent peroxiredoxin
VSVIETMAEAQSSCLHLRASATPPCADLRVSRRARAHGARALLLTAAALCALSGMSAGCSQPRAEGPKSAEDAVKSDTPPAAAANSPATAEPAPHAGGLLAVGAHAPDIEGKDAKGQAVRLSDRRGSVSIVYFYPKDGTPGCTKEACAFRDTFDRFNQRGVTIFGVSRDDEASHAKFRAEHSLPFPLVADPSGTIQKAYGVPDKMPGLASRVTFLVAADGRIAKVWPDVDPAVHADEVFQAIEQLK